MKTYDELKAAIERYGVHPVFGGSGELDAWIEQNPHELATFLEHMVKLQIKTVLEIGTGWKGGLSRFLATELGWDVTTVDVQDYGHNFPGVLYVVMGKEDDIDKIVITGTRRFDLVILDADHSYEGTKHTYELYTSHAEKALMFHDIAGLRDCEGVARFWRELTYNGGDKPRFGAYEVIDDSDQRGGIGYLLMSYFNSQMLTVSKEAVEEAVEPELEAKPTKTVKRLPAKKPAAKVAKVKKHDARR